MRAHSSRYRRGRPTQSTNTRRARGRRAQPRLTKGAACRPLRPLDAVNDEAVPLLEARAVAKHYGPVVALRSADLSVAPGEVHALLGANGAGKSTLVKCLTGVTRPDSGTKIGRASCRER